jgi:hypothetical protein
VEALGFHKPGMGDRNWTTLRTKSDSWSNQGLRYYKGEAWYRTTFEVPAKYRRCELRLWLGGIDDTVKAWIDGTPLEALAKGAAPIARPWKFVGRLPRNRSGVLISTVHPEKARREGLQSLIFGFMPLNSQSAGV